MKNIYFTILFLTCFLSQGIAQTVTIVANPSSSLVCSGENILLAYTQTGLTEPISCLWNLDNGIVSSNCFLSNTFYDSGAYMICITLTDANNVSVQDCINLTVEDEIVYSSVITNSTCTNNNDGSIECFPQSGSNYMFEWSTGATTESINGLAAGIYEVTITDLLSGCQIIEQFTVSETSNLGLNIQVIHPTDCVTDDGEISAASVVGGTAPYTYAWNNGPTTAVVTGLSANTTYVVTITDVNGCTMEESVTMNGTIPNAPLGIGITDINGNIDDDGIICAFPQATLDANISGMGYQYEWAHGEIGSTTTVTSSGTYSVTIHDANGCTSAESVDIVFGDPSYEIVTTDDPIICQGETIILDAGSGYLSYQWNSGDAAQTITVSPGYYAVTVEDAAGCYNTNYINVEESVVVPDIGIAPIGSICEGENFVLECIVTDNSSPIVSFTWSGNGLGATEGQAVNVLGNEGIQTYIVTATNANGCTTTASIDVVVNAAPIIEITPVDPICQEEDFILECVVTDNSSPIVSFDWTGDNLPTNSGQIISIGTSTVGTYTYTVIATNANGCTTTASIDVVVNAVPIIEITPVDPICIGDDIALECVVTDNGSSIVSFHWLGEGLLATTGSIVTAISTSIDVGTHTYTVIATNANGCTTTASIDVVVNDAVPIIEITPVDPICQGESFTLETLGSGDTYTWAGQGLSETTGSITTGTLYLPGDYTYTVTVTNTNGCTAQATTTVTVNQLPFIQDVIVTNATACGAADGSASIVATGPGTLLYMWSNGDTGSTTTGLVAGTYYVTATSSNGCSNADEFDFTIFDSSNLAVNIQVTHPTDCATNDGEISATSVAGGTPPYTYLWSDGQVTAVATGLSATLTYTVTITDDLGCTTEDSAYMNGFIANAPLGIGITDINGNIDDDGIICAFPQATLDANISGMGYQYEWAHGEIGSTTTVTSSGTYSVTIHDANGCTSAESVDIVFGDPSYEIVTTDDPMICQGETIVLDAGAGNLSYLWNNGETTQTITVSPGYYVVTVEDAAGCYNTNYINVTTSPPIEIFNILTTDADCGQANGEATVIAIGGMGTLVYDWSNGLSGASLNTITGLDAGVYQVTISDNNGCQNIASVVINGTDIGPIQVDILDPACGGNGDGNIILGFPSDGTIYICEWSDGYIGCFRPNAIAGTYEVTIYDADFPDCFTVVDFFVSDVPTLTTTIDVTNATCNNADGTATAIVTEGSGSYNYLWNLGGTTATTSSVTGLSLGSYNVTITDLMTGCEVIEFFDIAEETFDVAINVTNATCNNADGTATAIVSNGSGDYQYIWSVGTVTPITTSLQLGTYTVTIVDNITACQVTESFVIEEETIDLEINVSNTTCDNADGAALVTVNNGSGNYNYLWSHGPTTVAVTNLSAGLLYQVTVTDNITTCQTTDFFVIPLNSFNAAINVSNSTCNNADGEATAIVVNGSGDYSYVWNLGGTTATSSSVTGLTVGSYDVTITDNVTGCQLIEIFEIEEEIANTFDIIINSPLGVSCAGASDGLVEYQIVPDAVGLTEEIVDLNGLVYTNGNLSGGEYCINLYSLDGCLSGTECFEVLQPMPMAVNTNITNVSSCGTVLGSIDITALGGNGALVYEWSHSTTTEDPNNLEAGLYSVTITDANGCTVIEDNIEVGTDLTPVDYTVSLADISETCSGAEDGFISYDLNTAGSSASIEDINETVYTNGSLAAGNYNLLIYNSNGCLFETFPFTVFSNPLQVSATLETNYCPGESLTLEIFQTFESYIWSTGETTQSISVSTAGDYTCTVTHSSGCTKARQFLNITEAEDCVWPGDANYDGLANNQDILFLGLAHGNSGVARVNTSIDWSGKLIETDWDNNFSIGINHKHADSNGNGTVEHDDTLAISQNYNLPAHMLRESNLGGDNILHVDFVTPTANYEEQVELVINLADVDNTVPEAYGLAFSLVFNYPEVINPASIQVSFGNSVFGPNSETITLFKPLLADGRMDFAITRFDHVGLENLQGEVLKVKFIIEDNIDGFVADEDYVLEANITNIYCIEALGEEIILSPTSSPLTMFGSNSITDLSDIDAVLDYYPNPTKDMLYLNMKGNASIEKVSIYDALGRLVNEENGNITSLKTSDWVEGLYFLEIMDNEGREYLVKIVKE